jgi:hypothetical protein
MSIYYDAQEREAMLELVAQLLDAVEISEKKDYLAEVDRYYKADSPDPESQSDGFVEIEPELSEDAVIDITLEEFNDALSDGFFDKMTIYMDGTVEFRPDGPRYRVVAE